MPDFYRQRSVLLFHVVLTVTHGNEFVCLVGVALACATLLL